MLKIGEYVKSWGGCSKLGRVFKIGENVPKNGEDVQNWRGISKLGMMFTISGRIENAEA